MREIIPIKDEQHWLGLRLVDLTSTAMPALFNMSPYLTSFELYHAKHSGIHVPFETNERVKKGNRGEQYCAQEVSEKTGWPIRKIDEYIRIPESKMGSSFDYEIQHPEHGWINLEMKMVDYFQYKEKFTEEEMPAHIEIQVQHQMECADRYPRTLVAVFTGIYDFVLYERDRDLEVGKALRQVADKFWADVAKGNEPKPDFSRDQEVINLIYSARGGQPVDATEQIESLVVEHVELGQEIKILDTRRDAVKAELHYLLGNAGGAVSDRVKLTTGWTKDFEGKTVTQDMVGTVIGARKGYRQCLSRVLK